jgi:hypothetical protein
MAPVGHVASGIQGTSVSVSSGPRAGTEPGRPAQARYDLFSYAVVDAYASSFTRAGYGDAVQAIRAAHRAGDRASALDAVPDEMVDAIDVVGDEALGPEHDQRIPARRR